MKTLLFIFFISLSWPSHAQNPDTFVLNHLSIKPDSAYYSINKEHKFTIYSIAYPDLKIIAVLRYTDWEVYCVLIDGRQLSVSEKVKMRVMRVCGEVKRERVVVNLFKY